VKNIYWLSQIQYAEQSLVGNELFILSQLLQDECSILPGFVLGNNLWREFLQLSNEELLTTLSLDEGEDYQSRQAFARNSRQLIQQTEIPQIWRTEIFQAAKQLNSPTLILQPFLITPYGEKIGANTLWRSHTCNCNAKAITAALKSVWSELFTASSLIYWQKLGLSPDLIGLSVLVRPLKSAYASGIVEISNDFIAIKANWGLEQSLLQGDAEPDEYYLDRDLQQIISQHLGHKNYAYRVQDVSLATPFHDCLEAYIPPENLAATYALDREAIAQLLQFTQDILQQQSQIKYLVWTVFDSPSTTAPNFYFTQLSDRVAHTPIANKITQNLALPLTQTPPLLSGIPVSPGTIQAEIAVIPDLDTHFQSIATGSILVTRAIDPQHIPLIKQVSGIITEIGGKNSHAAIVARELGIPAIANATNATNILHHGDQILLNGNDGHVYPPTTHQINHPVFQGILYPSYPIATKLMVNLAQPESIALASKLPVDGVGLLRSELMLADLLSSQTLAQWQESFQRQFVATLSNYLRQFSAVFAPRPVFYRSLDVYTKSPNPVLGDRGTYHYLANPTLFDLELEALQTVAEQGYHNIKLILPFVRSVDEFKFCYRRLENIGLTTQNSFQVWIMAEVPSVMILLPEYIRAGVQGIAIGTNDLTQLLLGVDREQTQFSDRGLNANHPAMQKAIAELIKTAHDYNIECCICGQAPVDHPDLIDKLVQWGINTISVEPDAVAETYKAISRAEKRILLDRVRHF
jgi:pyruvate, water dikinase